MGVPWFALLVLLMLGLAFWLANELLNRIWERGYRAGLKARPAPIPVVPPVRTEPTVPKDVVNRMLAEKDRLHRDNIESVARNAREAAEKWKREEEKKIRADAIKRHKNVTKGKTTEHLVPYMDDFEYNPSDCRFLGSPIDIIVFDGLSDGGEVHKVVFLEVKTGKSASLSTRERRVRDAIKDGRVEWRLVKKLK